MMYKLVILPMLLCNVSVSCMQFHPMLI